MQLRSQLFAGTVTVAVLIVLVATVSLTRINGIREREQWVSHTHEVISEAQHALKLVIDMETGQRGYLLAGREEFLEPYNSANATYSRSFERLLALTSDNPRQQAQLRKIDSQVGAWLDGIAQPEIDLRREQSRLDVIRAELDDSVHRDLGKKAFDRIRAQATDIEALLERASDTAAQGALARLLTALVDMETGQRGFLLSGKPEALEPYHSGAMRFRRAMNDLRARVESVPTPEGLGAVRGDVIGTVARYRDVVLSHLEDRKNRVEGHSVAVDESDARKAVLESLDRLAGFASGDDSSVTMLRQRARVSVGAVALALRDWGATGDDAPIETIYHELAAVDLVVEDLGEMQRRAYSGEEVLAEVTVLEQLANEWSGSVAEKEIALRKELGTTVAAAGIRKRLHDGSRGKQAIDSIRVEFRQFIAAERDLLREREVQNTAEAASFGNTVLLVTGIAIVLALVGMVWVSRAILRMVGGEPREIAQLAQQLAHGDLQIHYDQQATGVRSAIQRCADYLRAIVGYAESVASGDLDISIQLRGERDALGQGLSRMTDRLRESRRQQDEERWLKAGEADVVQALQGTLGLSECAHHTLTAIARNSTLRTGVVYQVEGDDLIPLADIGCEHVPDSLHASVGQLGRAINERRTVTLNGIGPDYLQVVTTLGAQPVNTIVVTPVIHNDGVVAVLELGFDEPLDEVHEEFLHTAADCLATALAVSRSRWEVDIALEDSQQKSERLEAAASELEVAREKAEEATELKSRFLANMSHEIRTPMTAILGFSDVLVGDESEEDKVRAAHTIKRNGEHLLSIINDILDLSKLEANKVEVEQLETKTVDLLADVRALMKIRAEAGVSFVVETGRVPERIHSDPTRLKQILTNLLSNAFKFTSEGEVRLSCRMDADDSESMIFEVTDSGIGMTEAQAGRLFAAFAQADASTTRQYGGTGLGLAISKRLAQALGGDLTATSEHGVGSCFTLTIEAHVPDDAAWIEAQEVSDEALATASVETAPKLPKGVRILLAEDGPDNQVLVSHVLRKAGGEVTIAENGAVAVEAAQSAEANGSPFDVILMDMQMPVLDGYGAVRKLREEGYERPIIALTANAMAEDRVRCLDAGCDDFATKPIQKRRLFQSILSAVSANTVPG